MNKTKARHDLLARFNDLQHDPRTGGELTVTTRPAPTPLVKKPDPQRDPQKVITALCETIHAVQAQNRALEDRLAALEQGKFGMSGQPATLTVTVRGGHSHAPAPTRTQPRNVRPCPMVQARAQVPDTGYADSHVCPLVPTFFPGNF